MVAGVESRTILKLAGVSKAYAGNPALAGVDLALRTGEIHALVGENGAGKSTLAKIVTGSLAADSGSMSHRGRPYRPGSPAEAQRAGVVAVQQELSLSPYLPVYLNLWMGHESAGGRFFIRQRELRRRSRQHLESHGVPIDVNRWVVDLSLEEQQVVEILKALALEPEVLVLDEPTSALGAANTRWLLDLMRRLRSEGRAILFISHRLPEVMELADEITTLKDGRKVATMRRGEVRETDVIRMMVGRDLQDIFPPKSDPAALAGLPALLQVENLQTERVSGATFSLRAGEVVGLAGLEGQGQHELMLALFGLRPLLGGSARLAGNPAPRSPARSIGAGLALVPVDRRTEGVVMPLSVSDNISLATLDRRQRLGWVDRAAEHALVRSLMTELGVRAAGERAAVETLSGGNQQKVALAKWLAAGPRVLLLDDPTRGVDIETRRDLYYRIRALARQGVAVLLNSTDAIELVGMCDRVLVMYEGRIVRELASADITEEGIVGAAVGVKDIGATVSAEDRGDHA